MCVAAASNDDADGEEEAVVGPEGAGDVLAAVVAVIAGRDWELGPNSADSAPPVMRQMREDATSEMIFPLRICRKSGRKCDCTKFLHSVRKYRSFTDFRSSFNFGKKVGKLQLHEILSFRFCAFTNFEPLSKVGNLQTRKNHARSLLEEIFNRFSSVSLLI